MSQIGVLVAGLKSAVVHTRIALENYVLPHGLSVTVDRRVPERLQRRALAMASRGAIQVTNGKTATICGAAIGKEDVRKRGAEECGHGS